MTSDPIEKLIRDYESVVKGVDRKASDDETRAYGGVIRSEKGKLLERITEQVVKIAWANIGGKGRIEINSRKQKIPIRKDYIDRIEDDYIKQCIFENAESYNYKLSVDKQVFIDGKMVIGIECKSYT